MNDLSLFTDPASFAMSSAGSISGVLSLRLCDEFFPEERWNDLVLPICGSWLESLIRIVRNETQSATVRFMDGPFLARLVSSQDSIAIDLVESRLKGDVVKYHTLVNTRALLESTILTASKILKECDLRGWCNPDITWLRRLLTEATAFKSA
jgi:hypothetical protein